MRLLFEKIKNFVVITFIILVFGLTSSLVSSVSIAQTATPVTTPGGACVPGDVSPDCNPPRISDVQIYLIRIIYFIWAFGGLIFLVYLILIGVTYLGSAGNADKQAEAKSRAGKWIIGILLFFLARTLVATVMKEMVSDTSTCYTKLNDPGFTIFFADVCTSGDLIVGSCSSTPVPASILDSYCVLMCDPTKKGIYSVNQKPLPLSKLICNCSGVPGNVGSTCAGANPQ